jgi:hypothetical protein
VPPNDSPETLALRLFVEHHDAWDYVWTRHILIGSGRRVATYAIDGQEFAVNPDDVVAFESSLREWFASNARGEQAEVLQFTDRGQSLMLIRHGSYQRTVPMWEADAIGVLRYRPAFEDVLVYDVSSRLLRVQASSNNDRDEYLRLFARHLAGDESLAERAAANSIYSLEPFQLGTFNYGGAGVIAGVRFVQAQMQIFGVAGTTLIIKSRDVLQSFAYDVHPLSLQRGILEWVRLRFEMRPPGRRATSVTFTISPPTYTNLRESRYGTAILRYLEEQGVKLR